MHRNRIRGGGWKSQPRASLEPLEARQLLAAVFWDGGAGDNLWQSAANWSQNLVPTAADDVTIDVAGTPTIVFNADTGLRTVNTLLCNEALTLTGGVLTAVTSADINAVLRLDGGELAGSGTWDFVGGQLSVGISEASRISFPSAAGGIVLTDSGSRLKVGGPLLLNGTLTATLNVNIVKFEGAAPSLTGNASVIFTYGYPDSSLQWDADATLTLGPQVTVRCGDTSGWGQLFGGSLVNHGTIGSASVPTYMRIEITGTFTNTGLVHSIAGSMSIGASPLVNTGTIRVDGGGLELGGTFTRAQLGTLIQTGGNVGFGGTFDNTGGTLDLLAASVGGTIIGGTINLNAGGPGNGTLTGVYASQRGVLRDVNVNGTVNMLFSGNLTLAGSTRFTAFRCDTAAFLYLDDGFVLRDPIIMEATSSSHFLHIQGARDNHPDPPTLSTVTIAPTGSITVAPTSNGRIELYDSLAGPIAIINQGLLACESPDGRFEISPLTLVNHGTIRAHGLTSISPLGSWSNSGTIEFLGGTTSFGGTWDATGGEGAFVYSAGNILIGGSLNNAGNTFNLGPSSGAWIATTLLITGGTLALAAPYPRLSAQDLTLVDVAVQGDLSTSAFGSIKLGGTVGGTYRVDAAGGSLVFAPGTILTGTILAEGNAPTGAATVRLSAPGTFTIAPGGSIRTDAGFIGTLRVGDAAAPMTLENQGTISSLGGTLSLEPAVFTNTGLMTYGLTSTLRMAAGVWNANGGSGIGFCASSGGTFAVVGLINNANSTIHIGAQTGSWTMSGGTIQGGTIVFSDSRTLLLANNYAGRLQDVIVQSELNITTPSTLTLAGGTQIGTIHLAGSGSGIFLGAGFQFGGLILIEGATGTRSIFSTDAGAPRGLTSSGIIRIVPGTGANLIFGGNEPPTILGQVQGQATGRSITLQGATIWGSGSSLSTLGPVFFTGLTTVQGGALAATAGASGAGDVMISSGSVSVGGTVTFTNTADFTGAGTLSISGSAAFAARVNVSGTVNLTGGTTSFAGGLTAGTFNVGQGATVTFNVDSLAGTVNNSGTISLLSRLLQVTGNYTQTATGTLGVRLNFSLGATGLLAVGGTANLAGTAALTQSGTPVRGNWKRIIDAASFNGQFATVTTPTPGAGSKYATIYEPTRVRILYTWTADWDNSAAVDPADVAAMVNTWFTSLQNGTLAGDFDGNGQVQPADIALFIQTWLAAIG